MYFMLTEVNPFQAMVEPVIGLINQAVGPALLLVGAFGTIYCIILGVRLARANDPPSQAKARANLKNAIVGFLLIYVLIVLLNVTKDPLTKWMAEQAGLAL